MACSGVRAIGTSAVRGAGVTRVLARSRWPQRLHVTPYPRHSPVEHRRRAASALAGGAAGRGRTVGGAAAERALGARAVRAVAARGVHDGASRTIDQAYGGGERDLAADELHRAVRDHIAAGDAAAAIDAVRAHLDDDAQHRGGLHIVTVHMAMEACAAQKHSASLVGLLEALTAADRATPHARYLVAEALLQMDNDVGGALTLFKRDPDIRLARLLLWRCKRMTDVRPRTALSVLDEMARANLALGPADLKVAVTVLLRDGDGRKRLLEEFNRWLGAADELPAAPAGSYFASLEGEADVHSSSHTVGMQHFEEDVHLGMRLMARSAASPAVVNYLLAALGASSLIAAQHDIVAAAVPRGYRSRPEVAAAAGVRAFELGLHDSGISLFVDLMKSVDADRHSGEAIGAACARVVVAALRADDLPAAFAIIERMARLGTPPTAALLHDAVETLLELGKHAEAQKFMEHLTVAGCFPTTHTVATVVRALLGSTPPHLAAARRWTEQLVIARGAPTDSSTPEELDTLLPELLEEHLHAALHAGQYAASRGALRRLMRLRVPLPAGRFDAALSMLHDVSLQSLRKERGDAASAAAAARRVAKSVAGTLEQAGGPDPRGVLSPTPQALLALHAAMTDGGGVGGDDGVAARLLAVSELHSQSQ